jgi:hypothetical protein
MCRCLVNYRDVLASVLLRNSPGARMYTVFPEYELRPTRL